MSTRALWRRDWVAGLAVVVILWLLSWVTGGWHGLEGQAYDQGLKLASRPASDQVAVIAIDEKSLQNLGRWPWSRDVLARLLDKLTPAKPKAVVQTVFLFEPQTDPGLVYINKLLAITGKATPAAAETAASEPAPSIDPTLSQITQVLKEAEKNLNVDRKLADATARAGNVILPMNVELPLPGDPIGKPDPLPDYLDKFLLGQVVQRGNEDFVPHAKRATLPLEALGRKAGGIGFIAYAPDNDGVVRRELLYVRYGDNFLPSLSLVAAARQLNLNNGDIGVTVGGPVQLGSLALPGDPAGAVRPLFQSSPSAFPVDSFFDVLNGTVPVEKYSGKLVLIGTTAAGLGDRLVTPVSATTPPVMVMANSLSAMLQGHFVAEPSWGGWATLGAELLVALYLILLLPRLSAGVSGAVSLVLLLILIGAELGLLSQQLVWIQLIEPAMLLLIGHILLTTRRFLFTERGKARADLESAESNRMLGLAFQSQGQLDLAFDKFKKCPLDEGMMDVLYTLALDFERKRQFNKSLAVFQYMAGFDPKFRDLGERLSRAKQMSETVILGGSGAHGAAGTLITAGAEKPMLGRYVVEKELGKGAMGVVYFGRDPKIGRTVAIKTMALSQEFEAEELDEARARFFREAETAGRLNHPNIVTIYDAGEEHDLAYIAMEFLKGRDLVDSAKQGQLLPLPRALSVVARVADALGYAHQQSVVHRDIKPANIMYEGESDTVKVTDFGIARITDASKTKTGMVLGTPSYMSPEQLSGKKIDGRSDLFSLGVTLYQLVSGHLPFVGDSMAELMFRIANDPPRDIAPLVPDLPRCVHAVLTKALQKDIEKRYQNGAEFAEALRQCLTECGNA